MSFLRAYLVTAPLIILATIGFGLVSLVISLFETSGRKQIAVARVWARFLLWGSGVRVKIEGLEKIAPNGSYVFVSNHLSYMDTPVVLANIPVQFRFLAKRGLFQIPLLGTHLARAGHIPVPRGDAHDEHGHKYGSDTPKHAPAKCFHDGTIAFRMTSGC